MSKEIIIGQSQPQQEEEKVDKIYDLVEKFKVRREIMGDKILITRTNNGDGTILRVQRNEHKDFLEVRYGEEYLQMNLTFTLYKGTDDQLINNMKKLDQLDKDDWDRFFIYEDKNEYGAIMIGLEQFEELFPKMYNC